MTDPDPDQYEHLQDLQEDQEQFELYFNEQSDEGRQE